MSKLEELIKEKCPDGVPYKRMGELGKFFGGLTGKDSTRDCIYIRLFYRAGA